MYGGGSSRLWLGGAAVGSAFALFALSEVIGAEYSDAILFGFVASLTLGAGAWGLRGGLAIGGLCAALAAIWWFRHAQDGGPAWIVARTAACLSMGALLGWLLDQARRVLKDLAHHQEFSLDMIVTSNFEGRFTRVSPSVTRLLGFTPAEFLSRPYLDQIHPDDVAPTLAAVADQAAGNEILSFQNRYRTKDGSYRWLEWTSRPDLEAGEMLAVARDVTARREIEDREHAYQERLEAAVKKRTRELEDVARELQASHHETLARLALAAEYRDDNTHAHTSRVADTAGRIASELGVEPQMVALIREAALLHDVGKVGIPDTILLKPGRLTGEEFDIVKTHAEIGRLILAGSTSEILRTAEEIAAFHHEWWDGTGYPYGLAGTAIPLSARIVALADVYDALTHDRPYKYAWPEDRAVDEIHRLCGIQFDPAIVNAFERLANPTALQAPVLAHRS